MLLRNIIIKEKNYEEVTRNWLARKKVSTGKVIFRKYYVDKHGIKYKVDGKNVVLHPNINEIETAKLICGMFGENIYLNPKINFPNNIRSSDYLWRNQYWDKKIIGKNAKSNLRAVDNSIKRGKEQADYFILVFSGTYRIIKYAYCKVINAHNSVTIIKYKLNLKYNPKKGFSFL